MSNAVQLYPHAVSTALALRLDDFDDPVEGSRVSVQPVGPAPDSDERAETVPITGYDAFSSGVHWKKLAFRMIAELPKSELDRVLPSSDDPNSATALVVLMTCQGTKFRHGVRLSRGKSGSWTGHAVIQRADVKGVVVLRPQLFRTTDTEAKRGQSLGTKAGMLVASGEAVTVYVDHEPSSAGFLASSVMMSWEDFANSDHSWRREHPDDVFHLEPYGGEPRLYLNSRYTQLREILESNVKRGPEAVLRDMNAAIIAQPVLVQLATVALMSLEADDDSESVGVPSGWRGDLIASVLPRLYPEEISEESRLRRANQEIHEADGSSSLLARLGSVVQEMTASYKTVESSIRTFESTREREDGADD